MASRARQSTAAPAPRHPTATPGARRTTATPAPSGPEYETPAYPLNPAGQRALANLTRTHDIRKLTERLSAAQEYLNAAAVEINDRTTENAERVQRVRKKREGAEDEFDTESFEEMEQKAEQMKQKVENMTKRMEETMRKLIDGKQDAKFLSESVDAAAETARNNASTQASTQNLRSQRLRNRNQDRDDEEDGENGSDEENEISSFQPTDPAAGTQPEQAPLNVFRSKREEASLRYQNYSMNDRYGKENDYINFRRAVHDAQYPGDEVPMPPPSEWFNEDGTVAAPGHTARRRGNEEDESDDEIAIERATVSTKCPLTLQEFKEPISSTKCAHSFEKTAIMELFGRNSHVRCPVGGCNENLTKKDLRTDPVIVRKIQRLQKARQMQQEQDEDDDEDEDDHPRGNTQRRAHSIDDDDAADIDDEDEDEDAEPLMKTEPAATQASRASQPPRPSQAVDLGGDSDDEDEEMEL